MQILRHSSLFPPARIDSSILPARQERSQHSSRPPGSSEHTLKPSSPFSDIEIEETMSREILNHVLPARQDRFRYFSRPPGSIPAFFLPARNDPSIFPALQDRSQHSSRPPGSIPAPLSACTMKYCYFELSAKCTCAFTCTFYVRVCMHLFVEIGLAR